MQGIGSLAERGGDQFYRWFNQARVVLMFALGCVLIIYSVIDSESNIAYIVVGAVLIGLVPDRPVALGGSPPARKEAGDAGRVPASASRGLGERRRAACSAGGSRVLIVAPDSVAGTAIVADAAANGLPASALPFVAIG